MTNKRTSAVGALDAFFAVVRRYADSDSAFAAELVDALGVPIELNIESPADVKAKMLFLDPVVIAGQGLDKFRNVFAPMTDVQRKAIIKHYNLADLPSKGAPKGEALVKLMWDGALSRRSGFE
jgi:hypothetical protein